MREALGPLEHIHVIENLSHIPRAQEVVSNLLDDMIAAVHVAESERQKQEHVNVAYMFETWTRDCLDQRVLGSVRRLAQYADITIASEEELMRAFYAGIGRVEYVDTNAVLSRRGRSEEAQQEMFRRLDTVESLYQRIDLGSLPPWTVDQNPIYWMGAIQQDRAHMKALVGNKAEAIQLLEHGFLTARRITDELRDSVSSTRDCSDQSLKTDQPELFRNRRLFVGALSEQGVMLARLGRMQGDVGKVATGLNYVEESFGYAPNTHRLATIGLWAVWEGVKGRAWGANAIAAETTQKGWSAYRKALSTDRKAAVKALIQMVVKR